MSQENQAFQRWYDIDPIVSKCVSLLENIDDRKKHQAATFLMNEIISKPPYREMIPDDIYNMVMGEERKRRWYDFDETSKIFMELLRHSPEEMKTQIAVTAITFLEDILD